MPTIVRSRKRHARTGRVDWAKVDETTDESIAHQIAEDADTAPELTEEALDRAVIVGTDGTRTRYRDRVPRTPGSSLLKPGSPAPESGVYQVVDAHRRSTGTERTVVRGDPLPPTPEAGQRWRLARPSKRKASA